MNELIARAIFGWMPGPERDEGLGQLARLLEVPVGELARVPTDPRLSYRPFTVPKRSGGKRHIVAPSATLKQMQRRVLRRYLADQPVHEAAMAFRPGASIATHARRHLGQAIVLTVDLVNFFPSTRADRVRRWFSEMGWSGQALNVLMRLSVYRGGLPQGAPTSPALSNLVNRRLDEELFELASMYGAHYSRYCDDLAFSWGTPIEPPGFRDRVEAKLTRYRYEIQMGKGWRLQNSAEPPELTGIVLDGSRLRLPTRILRRIRRLRSRWLWQSAAERAQWQGYRGLRQMLK